MRPELLELGMVVDWLRAREMGRPERCAVRVVAFGRVRGRVWVEHELGGAWVWTHELVQSYCP